MVHYALLLSLCTTVIFGMESRGKHLEIVASRKNYITQANSNRESGFCVFCDKETLKDNYIILNDSDRDIRLILNKNPYFPFDQGHHLVVMPISHEESPDKITHKQLSTQCYEMQKLAAALYSSSFGQELFTNWDRIAGQSVAHWHSQFKNYKRKTLSVAEEIKARKSTKIKTIEEAFAAVQDLLTRAPLYIPVPIFAKNKPHNGCYCCCINDLREDKDSLIVERFRYNFVCLSHYPSVPGELSVVPYMHVSSIKDLPCDVFFENMAIAMALLRKTREYANENIRDCSGGNLYTKSKGKLNEDDGYHLTTQIMPRTTIPMTPGALEGHSCKLEYDPEHYYEYVRKIVIEVPVDLK